MEVIMTQHFREDSRRPQFGQLFSRTFAFTTRRWPCSQRSGWS